MTGENVSLRVAKALQAHRWPGRSWDSMDLDEQDHCLDLASIAIDAAAGAGPADPPQQETRWVNWVDAEGEWAIHKEHGPVQVRAIVYDGRCIRVRRTAEWQPMDFDHEYEMHPDSGEVRVLRDPAPSPPQPATERVPWWDALREQTADHTMPHLGTYPRPTTSQREPGPAAVPESPEKPTPRAGWSRCPEHGFHRPGDICSPSPAVPGPEEPAPEMAPSVTPAEIDAQREKGWPDFGPEDYCHRCGGRNVRSWHVESDRFNAAFGPPAEHPYQGIVCPGCFVEAHERATGMGCTWALHPDPTTPFRWLVDIVTTAAASEAPTDGPGAEEGTP